VNRFDEIAASEIEMATTAATVEIYFTQVGGSFTEVDVVSLSMIYRFW